MYELTTWLVNSEVLYHVVPPLERTGELFGTKLVRVVVRG